MSRILDFYRGDGTDAEGRMLDDILAWSDEELEVVHDFIQWVFPLPEASQYNPDAPLLTNEDLAAFRSDRSLREKLVKAFERIVRFFGLSITSNGSIVTGDNFSERAQDVWFLPNHNWLRISRILRSLTLLGCAIEARFLFDWLNEAYSNRRFPISAETFQYWTDACNELSNEAPGH